MIDWLTASRCLAHLRERPERTEEALREAIRTAPAFQNTQFPLSPLPLYVSAAALDELVPRLERYVRLLSRIVELYRSSEQVRRWYGLGPAAEALIDADGAPDALQPVCRLDGYVEQGTGRLRLLENNADAPAGTLFSPRINHLAADLLDRVGAPAPAWVEPTFADELALLHVLRDRSQEAGLPGEPRLAILQFADRANQESHEMAAAFRAAGVDTEVADPRDIRRVGDHVHFGERRVTACWNKVNTVAWRQAVEADDEVRARWLDALATGSFVHLNPFGARYVAESKLTLAVPSDPELAHLFTAEERALHRDLVPWSRRVGPDAFTEDGTAPLVTDLLDRPWDYVLKEPYDIRGDGVTVGRAVGRGAWATAVAAASRHGHVAQRYVAPSAYPVIRTGDRPEVVVMPVSLDAFVLDGRVVGLGSKASFDARVNVFQGGRKLAVHVVKDGHR